MSDVEIMGMKILPKPHQVNESLMLLGHFDCEISGIVFEGCSILRMGDGAVHAVLPLVKNKTRRIVVRDRELWASLQDKAKAVFAAMGGTSAEIERRTFPATFTVETVDTVEDDDAGLRVFLGADDAVSETMERAGL